LVAISAPFPFAVASPVGGTALPVSEQQYPVFWFPNALILFNFESSAVCSMYASRRTNPFMFRIGGWAVPRLHHPYPRPAGGSCPFALS
jgi:hypothetical protein